jgi:hypothetical protein
MKFNKIFAKILFLVLFLIHGALTNAAISTPARIYASIDQQIVTALDNGNKISDLVTRCNKLSAVINQYQNNTVRSTTSIHLFHNIIIPLFATIKAYKSPLSIAQKADRDACVAFFNAVLGSKLLNSNLDRNQVARTKQAIKILNAME